MADRCTRGYGLLEKFLAKWRARIANKNIPSLARQGRILDIGCGATPFFLMNTDFEKKFGIDPAVDTNLADKNLTLRHHDIEQNIQLPFEDDLFDVVTMLAVFEHIKLDQLKPLLQEIHRVLKPEGRYILTTPSPWGNVLLWFMARFRLVSPTEIDEHEDGYHQKTIINYLVQAHFKKENIRAGYFEFLMNNWVVANKD
jgi:SAM-dependent methyltransferase